MTNLIRTQATALKNFLLKALLPVQGKFAIACDPLASSGSPSNRRSGARVGFRRDHSGAGARGPGFGFQLLFLFALLMGAAGSAQAAESLKCGYLPGVEVLDGDTYVGDPTNIGQISIEGNCIIKNFPVLGGGLGDEQTLINFNLPKDVRAEDLFVVFDNVYYNGGFACANIVQYINVWWVNGSFSAGKCTPNMVPVDSIKKEVLGGQSTAAIGVPFKYTLTLPVMMKYVNAELTEDDPEWDDVTLSNVHVFDNLTPAGDLATGVDLQYLGYRAYFIDAPNTPVTLTESHSGDQLHFSIDEIQAKRQLVIEIEVVLRDNPTVNVPGTSFYNTASWYLTKEYLGQPRELPGQNGISEPLTITAPNLVVDKSSTEPNLNLGTAAPFTVNVLNNGTGDAWNATITDILPDGMCATSPLSSLSVQKLAADGVTSIPLNDTDYSAAYSGCTLSLTLKDTAAAKLAPSERLLVNYDARFDPASSPSGAYTNVAGATQWFNADSGVSTRLQYDRTLTDGTPGVLDFQDAYTINAAAQGYYFLKTVANLSTGASPATTAAPGNRLRYTLQIQNFTLPTLDISTIIDDLDALNASAAFVPGTLSINWAGTTIPAGNVSFDPNGGAKGTGAVTITGLTLASNTQYQIQFDVTLASTLPSPFVVSNQASLTGTDESNAEWSGLSDDPYVGVPATALLGEPADPTRVLVQTPQAPLKRLVSPAAEATIGETVTYQITVPETPYADPLSGVVATDTLDPSLVFVNATATLNGAPLAITTSQDGQTLSWNLGTILAGQQAVITLTARVANTDTTNAGGTFTNAASYTYTGAGQTFTSLPTAALTIVEPLVTVTKAVTPTTQPTAGDVLHYSVNLAATSGANYSGAFDTGVVDTLSLGLTYVSGTARVGGVAVEPDVAGDGVTTAQTLTWSGIDIPEGTTAAVTYDVKVLNSVVANQTLTNSVTARWTSLDGASDAERTGTGEPAYNDYFASATTSLTTPGDATTLAKARLTDTYGATDANLRVGDLVDYELRVGLQEGSHTDLVLKDTLPAGMAFENVVSANYFGTAQTPAPAPTVSNQTLTWNLGDVVNATADNDPANDYLVIVYRARVMNNDALAQEPVTQTLTNNATLDYTVGGTPATQLAASQSISVQQPLLTVSKTAAPAGGDNSIGAGEVITYTVDIANSGAAPAYDTVLVDTLPAGLRQGGVTTTSIALLSGGSLAPFDPAFDPATGVATWNFDNGTADTYTIPAGDTLRVVYTVKVDADVSGALTLTNAAVATLYYSFDDEAIPANGAVDEREVYGPTNTATATLTTPAPALAKANTQTTAAVGEQFKYRITVPAAPVDADLYDVRILDDLSASAADMRFVSASVVSGGAWTLTNTSGSDTNLVIENTAGGIDIPAGGQAVIEITVELLNTPTNVLGLTFTNTASYTYNQIANTPASQTAGQPGTTAPMQIVGLIAEKTVSIDPANDNGTKGVLDAGDGLIYTITVNNPGTVPVSGVVLTDDVPENTAYVAGSVTLNGASVPESGASPLISGVAVNSAGSASGTIAANASAVVTFKVTVNGSVPSGTVISNQGYVSSNQPTLPTDADGDATNGYQPTTIVVGNNQQVAITKEVSVVGGGAALPGSVLQYVVRVSNTGTVDATNVQITDDLALLNNQATYVAGSGELDAGTLVVGTGDNPTLTANVGTLLPGATATLRFSVTVVNPLPTGTRLTNNAVTTWGTALPETATASIDIGGTVGSATLSGHAWHDVNFDNIHDAGETNLAGWNVALYRNSVQVASAVTDANGLYSFIGIEPTLTDVGRYELRFTAPGATMTTAKLGKADSSFSSLAPLPDRDGLQLISNIDATSGSNVQNLNLPIDPNGVVFDSVARSPITGATLTMVQAGSTTALPSSCFDDPAQQGQVTLDKGFYKFDLNFSDASCPSGGNYVIRVTPPATGYAAGPSRLIPPVTSETTGPYSIATCPADAVATPAGFCEAQVSASAPGAAVPAAQISHYLHLTLSSPIPGDSQLFNNHIAVDRTLESALTITKTSSLVNVSRSALVPYTITVNNTLGSDLTGMSVIDTFPPGFKYVEGSARVNNVAVEPVKTNRNLTWSNLQATNGTPLTIKLLFIVGSGVSEGEYVNRAQAFHSVLEGTSGEATATVRVIPDPTFDCTDVIGKVFDDANRNGYQDAGEKGLPNVRVATARGLLVTSDDHGRFHITCAVVPDENRGSNFILKVDDRTLPTGYRITTENPRVQRVTRGKMAKFNFGAAIQKIVRIDISNGVFEPGTTEMRLQWQPRMDLLLGQLKKGPSTLRLAYMAEIEDEKLVEARLKALKEEVAALWAQQNNPYELVIETEVFWRTGAPPSRSALK